MSVFASHEREEIDARGGGLRARSRPLGLNAGPNWREHVRFDGVRMIRGLPHRIAEGGPAGRCVVAPESVGKTSFTTCQPHCGACHGRLADIEWGPIAPDAAPHQDQAGLGGTQLDNGGWLADRRKALRQLVRSGLCERRHDPLAIGSGRSLLSTTLCRAIGTVFAQASFPCHTGCLRY
jgi:hypothetical protein